MLNNIRNLLKNVVQAQSSKGRRQLEKHIFFANISEIGRGGGAWGQPLIHKYFSNSLIEEKDAECSES